MYQLGFLSMILLIVGGILASASIIVAKKPEAEKAIKQIAPYQSWIGIALVVFGVLGILFWVASLRIWFFIMRFFPVYSILYLASIALSIVLGLILSMNFLKQRKEIPAEKLESIDKKLKPIQVPIGIASIAVALVLFISRIVGF